MSALGGTARISSIFGPLMGGKLAEDSLRTPFFVMAALIAVDVLVLFCVMPKPRRTAQRLPGSSIAAPKTQTSCEVFDEHRHTFQRVAFYVFCMMMSRESRNLLFPLKALDLGLDPDQIGQMTAASFFFESCMFPFADFCELLKDLA